MGFRFRRSIRIVPGVRINLGKDGVTSVSVGHRGMTTNLNRAGTKTTFGFARHWVELRTRRRPRQMPPWVVGGIFLALLATRRPLSLGGVLLRYLLNPAE